ncbi:MAG: glycosyltransferase family 4 protein [Rhodospirillales bacterium]|nr:glycosyltransferase family 4 protein [Rhodospirillales bacterium]MCW9039823.1 glycosyltransferase family 4 protein [Rhodospirillales bacterium]
MAWTMLLYLFLIVLAGSLLGVRVVLALAHRKGWLAHPNARSSHAIPTPHGAGAGILVFLLPVWIWAAQATWMGPVVTWVVPGCALFLAAISFIDDLRPMGPQWRFLAQVLVVAVTLAAMPAEIIFFGDLLAGPVERIIVAIAWLWFINLFNFMDGIDGLTGVETVSIGLGGAMVAFLAGNNGLPPFALLLASGALGFLWWNWHPARIFMGDVGSVPLGYLLGWLLLSLMASGQWAAALILPLYYLADATLTLLRRMMRGETVWLAHRSHFYQMAVKGGLSHSRVSSLVAIVNIGLVGLAVLSLHAPPVLALGGAVALVGGLLAYFGTRRAEGLPE